MILRFVCDKKILVEYGPGGRYAIPGVGDGVVFDGSDPDIPAGIYEATHVTHHYSLRGPTLAVVALRFIYDHPSPEEPAK